MESMAQTIRALKDVMELLTNQRGVGHTPKVFHQIAPPKSTDVEEGDFWIVKNTRALLVFDGKQWVAPA